MGDFTLRAIHKIAAAALPLVLAVGCGSAPDATKPVTAVANAKAAPAYNVKSLLKPKGKYLGIYTEKPGTIAAHYKTFKKALGKHPTLEKKYVNFGGGYDEAWARSAWAAKAIPQIEWEPHQVSLESINSGAQDGYITQFAQGVRRANVPITMSFGHEMNGYWYSWGRPSVNPSAAQAAQFVRAWRRIHNLFVKQGATNVIWLWSPNTIGPMPNIRLKPYWPGAAYVDWVGVIGYYRHTRGPETFSAIFDPTINEIHKFTKKPILLSETAARKGMYRNADIKNLLTTIGKRKDLIGLSWFNINKSGAGPEDDWRIENTASSVKTFRIYVNKYPFGAK
jgi:hypothetical protein